ncbi:MAG: hypothetical protein QM723_13140 [Myxococcaceae bacterium]
MSKLGGNEPRARAPQPHERSSAPSGLIVGLLGVLSLACPPSRWTRPGPESLLEHQRVYLTARPTSIYYTIGPCSALKPAGQAPTGMFVKIETARPQWTSDGLTDLCRSLLPIHISSSGTELVAADDLTQPGAREFEALVAAGRPAVVNGPNASTGEDLRDGHPIELLPGTPVTLIGRPQGSNYGWVARLQDGRTFWQPFSTLTEDPHWREAIRRNEECAATSRTWSSYPPLPSIAALMQSTGVDRSHVYRLAFHTRDVESVPPVGKWAGRYVLQTLTGPLVLNSLNLTSDGGSQTRELLVRATGRLVDVGLIHGLEMDVLFSSFPCHDIDPSVIPK